MKFDGKGDVELFANIKDFQNKTSSKNKIKVVVVESDETKNQKKEEKKQKKRK